MKYTVNKDKWNNFVFFIPIFILIFLNLVILINKKFIQKMDAIMLSNYPHYIVTKPLYYTPLNSKNIVIYQDKPIMAISTKEVYNKYQYIMLSNGIKGWARTKSLKTARNWRISIKENNNYKFYHLISLQVKNNQWILKVLDQKSWPRQLKIIIIDVKDIGLKVF